MASVSPVSAGTFAPEPPHLAWAGSGAEAFTEPRLSVADGLITQALARAVRYDYEQWLAHVVHVGECTHPIRLAGHVDTVETTSGEVLDRHETASMPDAAIYTACGNRRAAVCPACSQVYRADTYQLVAAGMAGGKGVPTSVASHPTVFLTLTARSYGSCTPSAAPGRPVGACRGSVVLGAVLASARMGWTCAAGQSMPIRTGNSEHPCAWTATTTTGRSCSMRWPVNSGGVP